MTRNACTYSSHSETQGTTYNTSEVISQLNAWQLDCNCVTMHFFLAQNQLKPAAF